MNSDPIAKETTEAPPVLFWFRWYTALMAAMYALCVIAGPVMLVIASRTHGSEREALIVQAIVLMIIGLPLAVAYLLPLFFPRKPWVWVYNLVGICVGLTSCCCLPAAVPLLIYWIKPETKAWFNRV
jgi:MFS family permease